MGDFMDFSRVIHSLRACYNTYVETYKNFFVRGREKNIDVRIYFKISAGKF